MSARYAIFYAPPAGSPLARLGARWLGRDGDSGAREQQPRVSFLEPDRLAALTAAPRRYGFHGTLKPPFHLAPGEKLGDLQEALESLAGQWAPFRLGRLQVSRLSGFLALTPLATSRDLGALANACVADLDRFRAPPSQEELRRRRATPLSASQERHLRRWGYPYVMEDFRFHMTLTGEIAPEQAAGLAPFLTDYFAAALTAPLTIEAISLFEQPAPDAPLRRIAVYPLMKVAETSAAAIQL